jgi:hypothetical protein
VQRGDSAARRDPGRVGLDDEEDGDDMLMVAASGTAVTLA